MLFSRINVTSTAVALRILLEKKAMLAFNHQQNKNRSLEYDFRWPAKMNCIFCTLVPSVAMPRHTTMSCIQINQHRALVIYMKSTVCTVLGYFVPF